MSLFAEARERAYFQKFRSSREGQVWSARLERRVEKFRRGVEVPGSWSNLGKVLFPASAELLSYEKDKFGRNWVSIVGRPFDRGLAVAEGLIYSLQDKYRDSLSSPSRERIPGTHRLEAVEISLAPFAGFGAALLNTSSSDHRGETSKIKWEIVDLSKKNLGTILGTRTAQERDFAGLL